MLYFYISFYKQNKTNTWSCPHPFQWRLPTSYCLKLPKIGLKPAWQGLFRLLRFSKLKRRYLKNGNSDLKIFTTLQIANLILYNFYFMQICHIFTPKALKLRKTKTRNYIHKWLSGVIAPCHKLDSLDSYTCKYYFAQPLQ